MNSVQYEFIPLISIYEFIVIIVHRTSSTAATWSITVATRVHIISWIHIHEIILWTYMNSQCVSMNSYMRTMNSYIYEFIVAEYEFIYACVWIHIHHVYEFIFTMIMIIEPESQWRSWMSRPDLGLARRPSHKSVTQSVSDILAARPITGQGRQGFRQTGRKQTVVGSIVLVAACCQTGND
jgi:hypothetical protein